MDEMNQSQNRSTNEADTSRSSADENSFIGKMKFGVSKILPNSISKISKWLSPKVDGNSRRRRHDEIDSEDDGDSSPSQPLPIQQRTGGNYQLGGLSVPPPSKKQRTFTSFLNTNQYDSISSRLGGNDIRSSTLIEDAPTRSNAHHLFAAQENGDHDELRISPNLTSQLDSSTNRPLLSSTLQQRIENDPDEGSSSQSRERPTNPFAVNNESSVVNFSAHLQRAKSLFSNRTSVSARLRNYRIRNPRSSLYRSTSSLCDNNSVSSNASSAMSSPFYSGQTTYGGASATSKRMSSSFQLDSQFNTSHRARIPTNLVTSKSASSSISSLNGTTSMSNTAKRILDVMSKYNTPLTELRRFSNALPPIAETTLMNKRSVIDLNITNEMDKSKRSLLKPNTPYNRPFGRNETPLTTELHVPTMPELLRLKKFATKTIEIRESANQSDSVLNRPMPIKPNEFKLVNSTPAMSTERHDGASTSTSTTTSSTSTFVASIKAPINNGDVSKQSHKNKIRTNLNKRRMGKSDDNNEMPEPVDLPNIVLPLADKKEISIKPFNISSSDSFGNSVNGPTIPFQINAINKPLVGISNDKKSNGPSLAQKLTGTGQFSAKITEKYSEEHKDGLPVSMQNTKPMFETASTLKSSFTLNAPTANSTKATLASGAYEFATPIIVPQTANQINLYNVTVPTTPFVFSKPIFVDEKLASRTKLDSNTSLSSMRSDPKSLKTSSSDSGFADASQSFGSAASKSTGLLSSKDELNTAVRLSQASTELSVENTLFKSISAKQKQDKWDCASCLVSNEKSASKCICCGGDNPSGPSKTGAAPKPLAPFSSIPKDTSKWECQSCLVRNNASDAKCVCCGESNGTATSQPTTLGTPQKLFSFGSFPTSSTLPQPSTSTPAADNIFKTIVAKQKASTWECTACMTKNDITKAKCICCEQAKDSVASTNSGAAVAQTSTQQFSFGSLSGSQGFGAPLSNSQFSFGNKEASSVTPAATFSFGNLSKVNEKPASAKKTETQEIAKVQAAVQKPKEAEKPKEVPLLDKAKEPAANLFSGFGAATSTSSTSMGSFSFGKPLATEKASSDIAKPAADNMMKKIVAEQSAKWECQSCMTKNEASVAKCVCCETAKDPTAAAPSKAVTDLPKSSFIFGSSAASTSFTFGAKAEPKSDAPAPAPAPAAFGSVAFGKPAGQFSFGSSLGSTPASTSIATITTPSSAVTFGTFDAKSDSASKASATPSFGFAFNANANATIDVTDAGVSKSNATAPDNALAKATINGPVAAAQTMLSFGQKTQTIEPAASKPSLKRSNQDLISDHGTKSVALSSATSTPTAAPFVFGQPQIPATSNTFGGLASTTPTLNATAAPEKPSLFGSPANDQSNAFSSPFGQAKSFVFGSPSGSAATPAASSLPSFNAPAAQNTASQNLFSSSAFGTAPSSALGGFGAVNATPTFGSPAPAPAQSPIVQQQAAPIQPASDMFQFGGSSNTVNSPFGSEPPKLGGFNFSAATTPSFNFTTQNIQPTANIPFQFGAPNDAASNPFAIQPAATTNAAIQNRRKLRPIRRINRP